MISPPQNTHVRSAVSPQQSIQEENEQPADVVGAGLPLIKRLLLLKAKEERIAKETHTKVNLNFCSLSLSISNTLKCHFIIHQFSLILKLI